MTAKLTDILKNKNLCSETFMIVGLSPTATKNVVQNIKGGLSEDCTVIGLNEAFVEHDVDLCVTIHPEIFFRCGQYLHRLPEHIICGKEKFENFSVSPSLQNEKLKPILQNCLDKLKQKSIYLFQYRIAKNTAKIYDPSSSGRNTFLIEMLNQNNDFLYNWSSICQTAMHLAYRLGAKKIILVGCESVTYSGTYRINGHTLWKGVPSWYRLKQYAEGNAEVAQILSKKGVLISTVLPFSSVNDLDFEYKNFVTSCFSKRTHLDYNGFEQSTHAKVKSLFASLAFWLDFIIRYDVSVYVIKILKFNLSVFLISLFKISSIWKFILSPVKSRKLILEFKENKSKIFASLAKKNKRKPNSNEAQREQFNCNTDFVKIDGLEIVAVKHENLAQLYKLASRVFGKEKKWKSVRVIIFAHPFIFIAQDC